MMRCARVFPVAALVLIAGCGPAATEAPPVATTLERNLAKMATLPSGLELDWRVPKERVAGAAAPADFAVQPFVAQDAMASALAYSRLQRGYGFMVWHDGALVASEFAANIGPQTPFASYSMHKTLLGLTVLAALEDGLFASLDDPVGDYVTAWHGEPRGAITLRQLLTHASGLTHYGFSAPESQAATFGAETRQATLAIPLASAPGELFDYDNANSQIVGIALSNALAARGQRYADYLSERLWRPLGNADAALWLDRDGGDPHFHSGFEAGLADWLRVGLLVLQRGQVGDTDVLQPASIAAMLTPSAMNAAYGLHIWRGEAWAEARSYGPGTPAKIPHAEPYLAPDVYFLDGFGGQRVYVIPSRQLVIARAAEVSFQYDDSVIVNTLLRGIDAAASTD